MTNMIDSRDALAAFREAAARTRDRNPKTANEWHDRMQACYNVLRESQEGRDGIVALVVDHDPYVRCAAAARSLEWAPEKAKSALEALRDSDGECSFDAEMVLQEFEKGRLSFNY